MPPTTPPGAPPATEPALKFAALSRPTNGEAGSAVTVTISFSEPTSSVTSRWWCRAGPAVRLHRLEAVERHLQRRCARRCAGELIRPLPSAVVDATSRPPTRTFTVAPGRLAPCASDDASAQRRRAGAHRAAVDLRRHHRAGLDRHHRPLGVDRLGQLLDERLRRAGDQRQLDVGPVLAQRVVDDGPALEERLARRLGRNDQPIGRLPDGDGADVADEQVAIAAPARRHLQPARPPATAPIP